MTPYRVVNTNPKTRRHSPDNFKFNSTSVTIRNIRDEFSVLSVIQDMQIYCFEKFTDLIVDGGDLMVGNA